jgi:hypothetical protein
VIELRGCRCWIPEEAKEANKGRISFTIGTQSGRDYMFVCETEEDREEWVTVVKEQIEMIEAYAEEGV